MSAVDGGHRTAPRHDSPPVSGRTAWILLGTGVLVFAGASLLVRAGATGWDERLYQALNDVPASVAAILTPLSKLFVPLGIAVAVVAAAVVCVVWNRSLWPIVFCAGSAAAAWLGANLAKAVAERTRPYEVVTGATLRQQPAHGTSFPSSHTAVAFAVAVTLTPFLPRRGVVVAVVYAVLVGWSRVYLGVHYPLDVVGGVGIGLAVGGGALLVIRGARGLLIRGGRGRIHGMWRGQSDAAG
jgi:membrane-associated phospholipid phosphatase